ncbi:acyl-CoA dehydrogenase family protein, partial [Chloroflexota bacterium]
IRYVPKALVREMEEDDKGYPPELWQKMAELGWLGLVFPERYCGTGGSFLDLVVLLEEMGYSLIPGPFLPTVLSGLAISIAGDERQRKQLLPRIASGQTILTLALTESSARYNASSVAVKAAAESEDYIITGTKLFVADANVAEYLICIARTSEEENMEYGTTMFLVDMTSPGISCTVLKTIAGDKQCKVVFDKVRVPKTNILGKVGEGWRCISQVLAKAAVAQSALLIGNAKQALDIAVNYSKERIQFGRPIGSFQALQHLMAQLATDLEGGRMLTYEAAWKISEGVPYALEVAMAKAWMSDLSQRISIEAHNIVGGVSYSLDHDLPLYFRRIKAGEVVFGDGEFHREAVARELGM